MIDPATLTTSIQNQITATVEDVIKSYVDNIIRELSLDSTWIGKIEQQINESMARKFGQRLSLIDLDSLIAEQMDAALARWFERQPNQQRGLKDTASAQELTIMDGVVVVENELIASRLSVEKDTMIKGTLSVQDLAVRGTINTDNRTWQTLSDSIAEKTQSLLNAQWQQRLVDQVSEKIRESGIGFDNVTVGGHALLSGDSLSPAIRNSDLRTVGTLERLNVQGDSDLHNSLSVRSRRVGVNTQHPDMALSVWDEEVALVFGKHREQTAYLGTLRPQRLLIGINRTAAIDINEQGRVSIQDLMVGRHRVCHEPECPNYSGTKGDIVFNSNPKGDGVWGWQCLGAFRWVPLRTT